MKIRELADWPTRMPTALSPFIETVTTSAGGYVVRWTPAGDRIGEIRHIGWRSWSAKCDTGCPPLLGSTRVSAARKLQRHVESHA